MQHKLTPGPLLDQTGNLAEAGYAFSLVKDYDRKAIKAGKMRIKEWDYYYIGNNDYGIALTIAILVVLLMAFTKKNFGVMIKTVFCNPVTYLVVLPMMALLFIECFYFNIHMAATFTVFILTLISNQKIEKEKDID